MATQRRTMTQFDGSLERTVSGAAALTVVDAQDYMRVEDGLESTLIENAIRAVQDQLEPPNGWLGRALTTASYRLTLPCFGHRIILPAPPFVSLESFQYLDTGGNRVEVDSSLYRIVDREPAEILLARNKAWPEDVDSTQPDAIEIVFQAGYGDSPNDVPEAIRQYMRYHVSQMYELRQPAIVGGIISETPFIRHMLESWRA